MSEDWDVVIPPADNESDEAVKQLATSSETATRAEGNENELDMSAHVNGGPDGSSSKGPMQSAARGWKPAYAKPWPFPPGEAIHPVPWQRPEQEPMCLTNTRLIDVETGKIHENMTVKMAKGRIVSVEKDDVAEHEEGYTTIDCHGLYLSPGLIDCHQHVNVYYGYKLENNVNDLVMGFNCRGLLHNGFTTVRDVGGATRQQREATEQWLVPGPRLFVCGPVLSQTGGHGDFGDRDAKPCFHGGIEPHSHKSTCQVVDGVDACQKVTRKLMAQGMDHIKICSSGGAISEQDKLTSVQFSVEEIRAITEACRKMGGTGVTSHCMTDEGALEAIEGGISGIEHGMLVTKPVFELMAQKGVYLVPTLSIMEYLANGPGSRMLSAHSLQKIRSLTEVAYESLAAAQQTEGLNIALGTDSVPQIAIHEFKHRARVCTPLQILQQATINGAKVVDRVGELGVIKPGAYADMLLLDVNPLEDITVLAEPDTYIKGIIKDGRCVRSELKSLTVEIPLV